VSTPPQEAGTSDPIAADGGRQSPKGPHKLGYSESDLARLREMAGSDPLEHPEDIRRVIDNYQYLDDWRANYRIQSVRSSLQNSRITCIDAAILSYGLLELLFPDTKRRLLAIHRRDPKKDEECGHCVTLYWKAGKIGSFSKSSFKGLGHRDAVYADEAAVASSYAEAYVEMGFVPLYFGVTTLEQSAPDLDWRLHDGALNEISDRLQAAYEYGFLVE
jgi:hypothetical protein